VLELLLLNEGEIMGNGHGRLRGANALADHRSRKERNSHQVRQMEAREAEAIIEVELAESDTVERHPA
jgi:hypothetical protein